jgi:hypothetical protein
MKLETFAGDVEMWSRFWEQFESSIDKDPNLPTINKHVILRGYLEGEPKILVDGIAVTATTCEETKEILQARYGDKNRIIQAHLDYLEETKPIRFPFPKALIPLILNATAASKPLAHLEKMSMDLVEYWLRKYSAHFRTITAGAGLST